MKIIDKFCSKTQRTRTTGIGSLPHPNRDAALEFSFKMGIPFLPQIPIRNAWEFMIGQALDGLAGLQTESDGVASLSREIWQSQSHTLDRHLEAAFSQSPQNFNAFAYFEPSAVTSSCWQPFLWELQERNILVAKVQIAGPLTAQWAFRLTDGSPADQYPELTTQIFRLVLARSLALVRRMKASQIQPILYIDEPGLYVFSLNSPKHLLSLQELKLMIRTLQKEGALVGLHCCSTISWEAVSGLGLDLLSIDTGLSLNLALNIEKGLALEKFIQSGGTLSLGIIPTARSSVLRTLEPQEIVKKLYSTFFLHWETKPYLIRKVLQEAVYTPACGLALQSTSDVEIILEKLVEAYENISAA